MVEAEAPRPGVSGGGERLGGIYIYEQNALHQISRMVQAESAAFRKNKWILENVVSSQIGETQVVSQHQKEVVWDTNLTFDLLNVVTVQPNTLSVRGLYQYVDYLRANGLDSAAYEHAMWGKIVAPIVTGIMVFLAIPFVFGPLRSVGIGNRVLVGALAGIGFYLVNQMFSYVGLVFGLNPVLSALGPACLAFGLGYWLLRRIF